MATKVFLQSPITRIVIRHYVRIGRDVLAPAAPGVAFTPGELRLAAQVVSSVTETLDIVLRTRVSLPAPPFPAARYHFAAFPQPFAEIHFGVLFLCGNIQHDTPRNSSTSLPRAKPRGPPPALAGPPLCLSPYPPLLALSPFLSGSSALFHFPYTTFFPPSSLLSIPSALFPKNTGVGTNSSQNGTHRPGLGRGRGSN